MLAAGSSQRLGTPKQLLQIGNKILINHMIHTIRAAGIEDLNVVLGFNFVNIRKAILDKDVRIIRNEFWDQGISSSVRVGLGKIDPEANEVIMFVVDQPFLTPELINLFISHYMTHHPGIMATRVGEQLSHPVLFTRRYFAELIDLQGDRGGKQLFQRHKVDFFDCDDQRLAIDIDTQVDYQKYQEFSGESSSKAA